MSGNWQKALYPVKGRERRSQPGGGVERIEEAAGGVRGTVVCLKKNMGKVLFASGGTAVADAGVMLPRFAVLCALSALSGAEELGGIPGTVGGGATMDAGGDGRGTGGSGGGSGRSAPPSGTPPAWRGRRSFWSGWG